MKKVLYSLLVLMVVVFVGSASISVAATEMFLFLDGIKGSSMEEAHKDWINVEGFNHQISNAGIDYRTGTYSASRADIKGIVINKRIDRASPLLSLRCCDGRIIPRGEIHIVIPGGKGKIIVLKYLLKNIKITSIDNSFSPGDNNLMEAVSISFSEIEMIYTPIDQAGSPGAPVGYKWNIETQSSR